MTAPDPCAKALAALLKRLANEFPPAPASSAAGETADALPDAPPTRAIDAGEPVLGELVWSFLLWESTTARAHAAAKRIASAIVDFNELRVCLPDELVRLLGERYPRAAERALRLRAALSDVVRREHGMSLQRLESLGKREARAYLESLDGVPPFVAARVTAAALGGHAVPVDERLLARLIDAEILTQGTDVVGAGAALDRRVRADDTQKTNRLLREWVDHEPAAGTDHSQRADHHKAGGSKRTGRAASQKGKAGHRS